MKVQVEGVGSFDIRHDKLPELLSFLSSIESVRIHEENKIREVKDNAFTGRELITD